MGHQGTTPDLNTSWFNKLWLFCGFHKTQNRDVTQRMPLARGYIEQDMPRQSYQGHSVHAAEAP